MYASVYLCVYVAALLSFYAAESLHSVAYDNRRVMIYCFSSFFITLSFGHFCWFDVVTSNKHRDEKDDDEEEEVEKQVEVEEVKSILIPSTTFTCCLYLWL